MGQPIRQTIRRAVTPALLALIATATALASVAPGATALHGPPDPSANRQLSPTTVVACQGDPAGRACTTDALGDINAARASEAVGPMVLPRGFGSLDTAVKLLVLSNLERVDRGLSPVLGLSAPLDADAAKAAARDEDPSPTAFNGDAWAANWEGGYPSPLEADFGWMYDDGYGSDNGDCGSPTAPGCWGHRHDILAPFGSPIVMGAAAGTGSYGPSMTELFVGGDRVTASGQSDAPIAPTWAQIRSTLSFAISRSRVRLASGSLHATVRISASGERMTVSASVLAGARGWSVRPRRCTIAAGRSCVLTVSASRRAPAAATLALAGPGGVRRIALDQPARPLSRSSCCADSVFLSPSRPIARRTLGAFVNWISR